MGRGHGGRDAVVAAMEATPRSAFLPPDQVPWAGEDRPLPIAAGQTNSQPRTVRDMLELLDVRRGDRVLDVGSGSGWTTVILARLTGRGGNVVGVERQAALVEFGGERVAAAGLGWARVRPAQDGVLGLPGGAPFDRILVSAQSAELPEDLVAQLAPGGVLVAPVAGRLVRVAATPHGADVTWHGRYSFVPLIR